MEKEIQKNDEFYMRKALSLAKKAYKNKDVPIGCVIVKDGEIISQGYNRRNKDHTTLAHAEIIAIRKATKVLQDWRLDGCIMYVTLEPCPMCAGAIVQARIPEVVIGSMNPKAGSAGSVINILDEKKFNHQVKIKKGVLENESSILLKNFFAELRIEKNKSGNKSILQVK